MQFSSDMSFDASKRSDDVMENYDFSSDSSDEPEKPPPAAASSAAATSAAPQAPPLKPKRVIKPTLVAVPDSTPMAKVSEELQERFGSIELIAGLEADKDLNPFTCPPDEASESESDSEPNSDSEKKEESNVHDVMAAIKERLKRGWTHYDNACHLNDRLAAFAEAVEQEDIESSRQIIEGIVPDTQPHVISVYLKEQKKIENDHKELQTLESAKRAVILGLTGKHFEVGALWAQARKQQEEGREVSEELDGRIDTLLSEIEELDQEAEAIEEHIGLNLASIKAVTLKLARRTLPPGTAFLHKELGPGTIVGYGMVEVEEYNAVSTTPVHNSTGDGLRRKRIVRVPSEPPLRVGDKVRREFNAYSIGMEHTDVRSVAAEFEITEVFSYKYLEYTIAFEDCEDVQAALPDIEIGKVVAGPPVPA